MHIAFYSSAWPPEGAANGVVTYVATMRDYLIRNGHRVSVVTFDGTYLSDGSVVRTAGEPGAIRKAALSTWDRLTRDSALTAYRLRCLFRELHRLDPIDVIEMEESFGWFGEVAKIGIPVIVRMHGPHFRSPRWLNERTRDQWSIRRERREGRAISRAAAITSPSRETLAATLARYQPRAAVREVIENPVAISAEHDRWSVSEADPDRLLWVGQFTIRKGPDIMIDALRMLLEGRPSLHLDMVGPSRGFMTESGESLGFDAYCDRCVAPHVRQRITYHGILGPGQIASLRRQAGLTAVTSRVEVFPYIVAEAMAMGAPVVSTPWPGVEGILAHDETGWIASEMSGTAIASAIATALADQDERRRIGQEAWDHARTHLSPEAVGTRTLRLYETLTH